MRCGGDFFTYVRADGELFGNLPGKSVLGAFTSFNLAAGKFPIPSQRLPGSLAAGKHCVSTAKDGGHNANDFTHCSIMDHRLEFAVIESALEGHPAAEDDIGKRRGIAGANDQLGTCKRCFE